MNFSKEANELADRGSMDIWILVSNVAKFQNFLETKSFLGVHSKVRKFDLSCLN